MGGRAVRFAPPWRERAGRGGEEMEVVDVGVGEGRKKARREKELEAGKWQASTLSSSPARPRWRP
jgi:hypothetical protein